MGRRDPATATAGPTSLLVRTVGLSRGRAREELSAVHAVTAGSDEPLIVPDARAHPLLRDNRAVLDLGVVASAGMALTDETGNLYLRLYLHGLVECRGCDVDERIGRLRLLLAGLRGRPPAEMVDTAVEALAPEARDDLVAFAIHVTSP